MTLQSKVMDKILKFCPQTPLTFPLKEQFHICRSLYAGCHSVRGINVSTFQSILF